MQCGRIICFKREGSCRTHEEAMRLAPQRRLDGCRQRSQSYGAISSRMYAVPVSTSRWQLLVRSAAPGGSSSDETPCSRSLLLVVQVRLRSRPFGLADNTNALWLPAARRDRDRHVAGRHPQQTNFHGANAPRAWPAWAQDSFRTTPRPQAARHRQWPSLPYAASLAKERQ
jgi:hypothetical protein